MKFAIESVLYFLPLSLFSRIKRSAKGEINNKHKYNFALPFFQQNGMENLYVKYLRNTKMNFFGFTSAGELSPF